MFKMENHTELSFLGTAGSFYIDARERTEPPLEKERHFELTVSKGIGIAKELRKLLAAVGRVTVGRFLWFRALYLARRQGKYSFM